MLWLRTSFWEIWESWGEEGGVGLDDEGDDGGRWLEELVSCTKSFTDSLPLLYEAVHKGHVCCRHIDVPHCGQ